MKSLSLFSGIGAAALATEAHWGVETIGFVEQNPYCQEVLARHWPGVPIYDDVCKVGKETLGDFDLLEAGFPCQDLSTAGRQAGLSGKRSGLFYEVIRIAKECQPKYVFCVNVPALLSKYHKEVEDAFEEIGYGVKWVRASAAHTGAPHLRWRVFLLATLGGTHQGVTDAGNMPKSPSSWSTPQASPSSQYAPSLQIARDNPGLAWDLQPADAVKTAQNEDNIARWPTPDTVSIKNQTFQKFSDKRDRLRLQHGGGMTTPPLSTAVQSWAKPTDSSPGSTEMWPTPRAAMPGSRAPGTGGKVLSEEVVRPTKYLWATPAANDPGISATRLVDKHGNPPEHPCQRMYDSKTGRQAQDGLTQQVEPARNWASPQAFDATGIERSPEALARAKTKGGCVNLREQVSGVLSPTWVEVLQGLPQGWTKNKGKSQREEALVLIHTHKWPAPMIKGMWGDSPQYDWEPPRSTTKKVAHKRARLKSLGNCNPPQLYLKALEMLDAPLAGVLGLFGF